jgi:quinol monooxygenase YgiN
LKICSRRVKSADEAARASSFDQIGAARATLSKENPMAITVIAKLKTKSGSEAQFEQAARKMIETVRAQEPGTTQYVLHRSVKDPTEFVYYEVYQDQASFDAHGKTPHMREFGGAIGALLEGRPQVDVLTEITRK